MKTAFNDNEISKKHRAKLEGQYMAALAKRGEAERDLPAFKDILQIAMVPVRGD
jgi:hypothetical protein